jgi:hypothetical protein
MLTSSNIFLALLWFNLAIIALTALLRPWLERQMPGIYKYRHEFIRYQILILIVAWSIYSLIKIIQK